MLAKDLLSDDIPPLKVSDTGLKALAWMDEFKVSQLPILSGSKFIGLVSDKDILDYNQPEENIGSYKLSLIKPYVLGSYHFYEVLTLVHNLKLTLVPVIDEEENYLGSITIATLLENFGNTAAVKDPGGILVLELNINDYSLAHIAQIVESNDAKIMASYVQTRSESTKMDVTIKINREDLAAIIKTFNRYNYNIKASFHHGKSDDNLKDRFDFLMNYIKT